jgi:hypothetical protein
MLILVWVLFASVRTYPLSLSSSLSHMDNFVNHKFRQITSSR